MKATGIIRKIDDLGRVVIPMEIRKALRIHTGDPLEIYTSNDGEIIFKKYSAVNEMAENAAQVADIMYKLANCPVVIFDRDNVAAAAGVREKEFIGRRASPQLEDLMKNQKQYVLNEGGAEKFMPVEGVNKSAVACSPIISANDVIGAVAFLESGTKHVAATELQRSLIQASAQLLSLL